MTAPRVVVWLAAGVILGMATAPRLRADETPEAVTSTLAALERETGGRVEATRSSRTGLVTFLSVQQAAAADKEDADALAPLNPEANARAFLGRYGRLFGLHDASQLRATRTSPRDAVGMDHVRFQQTEQGIPVTGAELTVHLRDARVVAVNGRTLPIPAALAITPAVGPDLAAAAARSLLTSRLKVHDAALSEPRLELFDLGLIGGPPRPARLAWFIEATRVDVREFIWVDAQTGGVLKHFSQLTDALNRTIYAAHVNVLPGVVWRREGGPITGNWDTDGAYDASGDAWHYFMTNYQRDSFDGAGAEIVSSIGYCPSFPECPYVNSFWNGVQMVFGIDQARSDDVVVHEYTHGLTQHTAGLFYYMQSGALNESFSDIFGETVDLTNGRGEDLMGQEWQIGEDRLYYGALRNMRSPNSWGNPGKLSDPEFKCEDQPLYGDGDNGGVHSNSGVPNLAYVLMTEGGWILGKNFPGIGLAKAGAVQYRALTEYLSSASDFREDYDAVIQACDDLIGGPQGITSNDCSIVHQAVEAVELGDPWPCAPPQASIPDDSCPVGTGPVFAFADDLENPSSKKWATGIVNTGNVWTGGVGIPAVYYSAFPRSGAFSFWGFDPDVITDSFVGLNKSVLLPQGATLYFNHSYGFDHDALGFYDGGVIEYSLDNGVHWLPIQESWFVGGASYGGQLDDGFGNPLGGQRAFVHESWGYTASKLDLSSLAGQNARFRFRVGTDNQIADYGWFIDDVRIYACDVGGSVALSAATYAVNESGPTVTITVTRSGGAAGDISVDYATSSGTATEGQDYTGRSGTLFFPSGTTGSAVAQSVTVPIVNDTLADSGETFNVTLSNPQGASLALGAPATGVVTIVDNDVAGSLSFGSAAVSVSEASTVATIAVKRTGGSASGVTVHYAASNGSAQAGSDYTAVANTLTFAAGVLTQTFQVPIAGDLLDEANETVNLTLSAPGGGGVLGPSSTAVLTITDNDTAGAIQFSAAAYSAGEDSGTAVITIGRSGGSAGGVTVHYATADGTASGDDYTGISGTLTFDAGQMTKTVLVPIAPDALGENNETVLLALSAPTGGATLGARSSTVLTIVEDETVMQFAAPQVVVGEAATKVNLTVKRSGNVAGTSSVHYSLLDGTAVEGTDYTPTSGTLNFTAQATSLTFSVTILNDTLSENPEFFVGHLSAPTGGTLGPLASATVLVNDDDAALALSAATYTGAEGTTGVTITVKRTGNKATAATVHYDTSSGSASEPGDSGGAHGVLTFNPNVTQLTFKVPIVDDPEPEATETLNLELSNATGALLGLHSAVVSITDNDPRLTFSAATYSVREASASSTITVKRSGPTSGTATVHYETSDGTATAGEDYMARSGTLTFNPGVKQLTFTVPILPDTTGEPAETVNIALTSPTGASLGIAAAVLTITDNDPSIAFSAATYTVKESRTATITVKRTGATTAPASVHYETSPGSATADSDYTTTAGTLNLGLDKASATFTVPILNDTMDEGAETVLLTLSSPTGGVLGLASATLQIDDDDAATAVKLGASSYSGSESRGAVTLTLTRTGVTGIPVTVTYATADVTAVAGTDYLGVSDSVTFAAGETLKVIEIPLFTNGAGSPAKSFTVTLLDPTNGATLAAPQSATVFITP